ncbi:MAG: hydroxylamine reductase [Candidatus Methanoplasma sp.]|nr:hydroxylamine reductase [Candidatus Methanoplasma sp.]
MKCRQCEETVGENGCEKRGACGKAPETADLQDRLIHSLIGLAAAAMEARERGGDVGEAVGHIAESLFATLTNANFDGERIAALIERSEELMGAAGGCRACGSGGFGLDSLSPDEDVRSLKEILLYGLKGLAAYYHHARALGRRDEEVEGFMLKGLAFLSEDASAGEALEEAMECGRAGISCLALLDTANTGAYGSPEVTRVSLRAGDRPGILVTGHDLRDLEALLEQTRGSGVDVYTHGEMLPANAYPKLKAYGNLVGNYGGAWHMQREEFESFNGPILATTNCIVPPRESYSGRLFTTGPAGLGGARHISERGGRKDFSEIVEMAKGCRPPEPIDDMEITIGFAHGAALGMADRLLEAIGSGAIGRLVVMAGCDGRRAERSYYSEFAEALPDNAVILTAGCAKYRYNKLGLGEVCGVPRVIDAGQCNDCYSLIRVAMGLAEAAGVGIGDLPLSFNISWYEQKACLVLLSLLSLGVKDIALGPTLPRFVSPGVLKVLSERFGVRGISGVGEDMRALKIA